MANTLIKRVGGKVKIREWIKSVLPAHQVYCEPFGGSFAVGFIMPRPSNEYKLVYNDLDSHVWNIFRVLKEHKNSFIEKVQLTLYSREQFEKSVQYIESNRNFLLEDPVDWAVNYLVYNRQSMFGKEDGTWCVSRTGENICLTWANLPCFIDECASFFKQVFIEHLDYKECIRKWDCEETLFYLDPPYENVEKDFYHVNKVNGFNHEELCECARKIKGSFAISYYDSEYIRSLYNSSDYCFYTKAVTKHMQTSGEKSKAQEVLIVKKSNYAQNKNLNILGE